MSETRTPIEVKRDLRNQISELKEMLHRGARKEIAEKLDVSDSYVREVLAGRRWDLNVIEELLKVATKNWKRALKAEKGIKDLIAEKKKSDSEK